VRFVTDHTVHLSVRCSRAELSMCLASSFEFSLIVPSTTAPLERNRFGRVWHRVVATARGAGMFGGDLTAEVPIEVICNPAPEGQVLGLDVRVDGYEENLGVCAP
jgi:hypothetical protein